MSVVTEPSVEMWLRRVAQEGDLVVALREMCTLFEQVQDAKRGLASLSAAQRHQYMVTRPLQVSCDPDPDGDTALEGQDEL